MHVQVVLFDGFDPLDVVAPYEVLHAGGSASGGAVTVELVSAEGPREVISGTGGLALRATGALDLERADLLVVPGASGRVGEPGEIPEEEVGAGEWKQDQLIPVLLGRALTTELPELLKQAMDDPGITVATVCGGSLVLAMAGLLEGRHATTHHLGLDMLDATGAHAVRARIVDDGDLISGGAVTSGIDLGLYLLERELGPRIAHAVEELFAHERRGTVWSARAPAPTTF
ncbi:DJ-1/PfpI family protein [Actinomadura logoneensis]|uniref:DJ-1/PfpI family protein n=1 Tax=Actinomadura logoneensis TaxID=2293572 RepID=A0A372JIX5_9ACTN|nr:DJ-1/PfpI family protein [Actinomadura logoneensis]